ncbi:hypothetical protein [Pandoraea sp.]|uniref:hypothetical protein n=1 Tax=Pandoraea sp. TaxID=1883445 RepID=UPI0035B11E69
MRTSDALSPATFASNPAITSASVAPPNEASLTGEVRIALGALQDNGGSQLSLRPSPSSVGRFTALMHHVGNFGLSLSSLGVASLNTVKETYDSSALATAHNVTLGTATLATLSSMFDLAVALGKYCSPSATTEQIKDTAWLSSVGAVLGSKHLQTYGGKYQTAILGSSMMLFFNQAGRIAGEHHAKAEATGSVMPTPSDAPSPSELPPADTLDVDSLQSCIGFSAAIYRAFGGIATEGLIAWMNAVEARRSMDLLDRQTTYESEFGLDGRYTLDTSESPQAARSPDATDSDEPISHARAAVSPSVMNV